MSKFIQERLSHVEKNFGDLCATFSSYARKTAKIRDKGATFLSFTVIFFFYRLSRSLKI